jgi:hypothetical protein
MADQDPVAPAIPGAAPEVAEGDLGAAAGRALEAARNAEAEALYRQHLERYPRDAMAHVHHGIALRRLGRLEEAASAYGEALRLDPANAMAHNNLGNLQATAGDNAAAVVSFRAALERNPNLVEAYNNLGSALTQAVRPTEAFAAFRNAIALRADYPDPHFNLGVALLLSGQLAEGWREYEWRWRVPAFERAVRRFPQRQWSGEALSGARLLLHAEQGLGDTLQFCRYVPLIAADTAIILEVQKPLTRLMASLPGGARIVVAGETLPEFDVHCPLMSLPMAFGTDLATIPRGVPYLAAAPEAAAIWRRRVEALRGLRVGLAWAGDPRPDRPAAHAVDRRRSLALAALAPLATVSGVSWISLQKGAAAAQAAVPPTGMMLHDWTGELRDFADTAALIEALDLVVTVDTAVVHLAGALGKPVWLLNRFDTCWRWLTSREDSPWYPTLRLYRQEAPGEWAQVIERVARDLGLVASVLHRGRSNNGGDAPPHL